MRRRPARRQYRHGHQRKGRRPPPSAVTPGKRAQNPGKRGPRAHGHYQGIPCIPARFRRDGRTTENRGVPGSSPGLATGGSTCRAPLLRRCFAWSISASNWVPWDRPARRPGSCPASKVGGSGRRGGCRCGLVGVGASGGQARREAAAQDLAELVGVQRLGEQVADCSGTIVRLRLRISPSWSGSNGLANR